MADSEAIIEVRDLYKIFGGDPQTAIRLLNDGKSKADILSKTGIGVGVNNVSFDARKGEILVFMGLSGSGKSTLIRCVNRLIEPSAGSVKVAGTDVLSLGREELLAFRRNTFGMVFQNFALFPHRTVLGNATFGLAVRGEDEATATERARESLELVGLSGWEDHYPVNLSGGMQQRVGLARALAVDPDILIMDEAFSALDPLIRREMQDELLDLQRRMAKTILFITHDLDEAIKLGDRIILLNEGALVQQGTAEEILTNPASDYVADFVENVDVSKVFTAATVMRDAGAVAYPSDGPRVCLRKMRERSISNLFVLDEDHRLRGVVTANDCKKLVDDDTDSIESVICEEVTRVQPQTALEEVMEVINETSHPVCVVDDDDRLQGIILRGPLLDALVRSNTPKQEVAHDHC